MKLLMISLLLSTMSVAAYNGSTIVTKDSAIKDGSKFDISVKKSNGMYHFTVIAPREMGTLKLQSFKFTLVKNKDIQLCVPVSQRFPMIQPEKGGEDKVTHVVIPVVTFDVSGEQLPMAKLELRYAYDVMSTDSCWTYIIDLASY